MKIKIVTGMEVFKSFNWKLVSLALVFLEAKSAKLFQFNSSSSSSFSLYSGADEGVRV